MLTGACVRCSQGLCHTPEGVPLILPCAPTHYLQAAGIAGYQDAANALYEIVDQVKNYLRNPW